MNKWQIICPVALLLVVAMLAGHSHFRAAERAMRSAIERQLGLVLAELETNQVAGHMPIVDAAKTILNNEDVEKQIKMISLFGIKDLFYNPSQPLVGGDAPVICARVGMRFFRIRASREVDEVTDSYLKQAGFVSLATTGLNRAEPEGATETRQLIRAQTNSAAAAAGSQR